MKMKRKGLALLAAIAAAAAMLIFAGCPPSPEPEGPQEYSITVATGIVNGSITASHTKAAAGTNITLTISPDEDYILDTLNVKQADEEDVEVNFITFIFTMPASDVTVNGQFKSLFYSVNIAEGIVNGTITADVEKAKAGTTITLTITPVDDDYVLDLDTLIVKQANGTEFEPTADNSNTFSFAMPASDVTVYGQFKREYFYVKIADGIVNGSITRDLEKAKAGTIITLTISPDNNDYVLRLDTLKVEQEDGTKVSTSGTSTTQRFYMPASDVTVIGQFGIGSGEVIILFAGIAGAETIKLEKDHNDNLLLGSNQTLTVQAPSGYDSYYWLINGEPFFLLIDGESFGIEEDVNEITVPASHPLVSSIGVHAITVIVKKGDRVYSENLPFRVVWW